MSNKQVKKMKRALSRQINRNVPALKSELFNKMIFDLYQMPFKNRLIFCFKILFKRNK